ncbi:MAG: hypothetical protein JSV09_09725 [Thermoplasmata archaeon]|nr:MAG: hypothetical protein JSV09_09725 [Thermoplasmata archaeon]
MSQKLHLKKEVVATLFCACLLLYFLPEVKGIDLRNYTFGVKVGNTHFYRVSVIQMLLNNGTMQKDNGGYPLLPYHTIHQGDTIMANITGIINGSLTYQLTLFSKDGSNATSRIINYNYPSDILLPLYYHFISTINTTLIEELASTTYRGGLEVNVTADTICLKYAYSTLPKEESTNYLYESVYQKSTGWTIKLYLKWWNDTHTLYECLIEDESQYTEPIPWHSQSLFQLSLILLSAVLYKKSKPKR